MKKELLLLFTCLFACICTITAQTSQVSGIVTSAEDGEPVIGASVLVKGTTLGTITDLDGKFTLSNLPSTAKTLQVSYVGLSTKEVAIKSGFIQIVLGIDAEALDEVVVTALGISREKKALGYAVSEVKGDELLKARGGVTNPINSLQGKVAGLQISGSSGSMGGSSKILIRGVSSISGNNQPLFVVDGVPIEGTDFNDDETARGASGYDYGNLIQDINPDDIENISVLKGPNASALYGSRATNGVIMITTKKGGKDAGYGVTFNSSIGFEIVGKLPKLQRLYGGGLGSEFEQVTINGKTYNYPDYSTDESWGPKLEGQSILSWYDLAKWEAGGKVGDPTTSQWIAPQNDIRDFFKTGVSFTNNISVSQGGENSSVRLSYTNTDLNGYMPNSSLTKNVFNVAGTLTSANKKLEAFTNVTYFNSRAKGRTETGYGDNNVMVKFVQWGHRETDMKQLKDMYIMPDGTQATWNRTSWSNGTPAFSNNPYWSRYMNYQNDSRNRVYGNVGFSYQVIPELKFQYKANVDFFVDKQYERNAVYSQELSRYKETSRQQYEVNHEFLMMFNKSMSDYTLTANFGGNIMNRRYEYVFGESSGGLAIPLYYNVKNSVFPSQSENYLRKKNINSIFGNATLGWRSMLYLDVSLRNDWSSTLPKDNNSYLYPSVTGSFVFSELLKEKWSWLTFGKLRLGYAMVGNDTDPYNVIDTYSHYTYIDSETATPGYIIDTTLKNANLKPETTNSYEIGLEMNFLHNRLGIEATYYYSETKDQIIPLTVSGSTGYLYRVINSGLITNEGFELALHGTPIKTSNFSWNSMLTLASNKNKVKELIDDVNYYRLVNAPFKVEIGAIKGEAYGVIMGTNYVYDNEGNRVIDSNGLYESTNGNENLGSIYPDFTGGWNNTFKYKNLDLSVLIDFSKGGHYFSTSYMWGMYSGMLKESAANNIRDRVQDGGGILLDGVQVERDASGNITSSRKNDVKAEGFDYAQHVYSGPAAQSVFKSDYIKLREINIGYTFPMKKDYFIKSLRVAAYGRNLAVWGPDTKHFDPEMIITGSGNIQGIEGGAIPAVVNCGLNVSVKF